jgi:hypothetical protein
MLLRLEWAETVRRTGLKDSVALVRHWRAVDTAGRAMPVFAYLSVLVIALGGMLFGLDWLSAPMSPMVDTEAGLHAAAPPAVPAPAAAPNAAVAPNANIGAPIRPPGLVSPARPNVPAPPGVGAQVAPPPPLAAPKPEVTCNVDACTAAYRTFTASDCTYQPIGGPRRLCTK